jgi:hypothetical protein
MKINSLALFGRFMMKMKWLESSLRKIYDTGEYSFDELMNVLKSPIAENIQIMFIYTVNGYKGD